MQKKFKKAVLKIFMTIIVVSQMSLIYTFAADVELPSNVQLVGNADGIVLIPGEGNFLESHSMLPGDSISRQLVLKNDYSSEYEIYVRAERVDNNEEYDLLNMLQLTIDYDGEKIYEGPASGEKTNDSMTENISLGILKRGEEKILNARVLLPGELVGNEYKNKTAQVNWIFTAVRKEKVEPPITNPELPQTGEDFGSFAVQGILAVGIILIGIKLIKK